jgi:hypothetical protein
MKLKKITFVVSLLGILFFSPPPPAFAWRWFGFTYEVSSGFTAVITGYTGAGGAVEIPKSILCMTVVAINEEAFYGRTGVTSVSIPSGVLTIGDSAFEGCTGLSRVTINEGVESIGDYAFKDCTSLASVTIPYGVTDIARGTFEGCTGLSRVSLNTGLRSIGATAFKGCTDLTSISIPASVTTIGDSAFFECTGLSSVTMGKGVERIEASAFEGCTGLSSVTVGAGVSSIGASAFKGCEALESISIPASVTTIGDSAFEGCMILDDLTFNVGVKRIGDFAFKSCTDLDIIIIPSSVSLIGDSAFFGCRALKKAFFCGDAPTLEDNGASPPDWGTFSGCASSFTVHYNPENTGFDNPEYKNYSVIADNDTENKCAGDNPPQKCLDNDDDGYGAGDGAGCPHGGGDCDDNNTLINPGAVDCQNAPDGVDNDCDGKIDEGYCVEVCLFRDALGEDDPQLEVIRAFRENVLSKSAAGQKIIGLYYAYSPGMVSFLDRHPTAKEGVKLLLKSLIPALRLMQK